MPLEIEITGNPQVPLEVETIRPDSMEGKSSAEISKQKIFHGKEEVEFGDFFKVSGTNGDVHRWSGDFSGVHWIGAGLTAGKIEIDGDCGRHLGSEMRGGEITVSGNASDWVGAEMKNGMIDIKGDAGHLVGSAYRGSPKGMTGGTILVHGRIGNEVGHTMRRGLIAAREVGDLAGFNMLAGSIFTFGETGIRHGAGMRRGTIGFFGKEKPEVLPTFRFAARQYLGVLEVAARFLASKGYPYEVPSTVDMYHGDLLEGGRGEILLGVA